eukprot:3453736-Pyramimonas_sp.AAC.1
MSLGRSIGMRVLPAVVHECAARGPRGGGADTPGRGRPPQLRNPLGDLRPHPGALPRAEEAAGGIRK